MKPYSIPLIVFLSLESMCLAFDYDEQVNGAIKPWIISIPIEDESPTIMPPLTVGANTIKGRILDSESPVIETSDFFRITRPENLFIDSITVIVNLDNASVFPDPSIVTAGYLEPLYRNGLTRSNAGSIIFDKAGGEYRNGTYYWLTHRPGVLAFTSSSTNTIDFVLQTSGVYEDINGNSVKPEFSYTITFNVIDPSKHKPSLSYTVTNGAEGVVAWSGGYLMASEDLNNWKPITDYIYPISARRFHDVVYDNTRATGGGSARFIPREGDGSFFFQARIQF